MKKHSKVHKLMNVLIAAIMIVGMIPVMASADTGQFKVDWDNVGKMSGDGNVQQWAVVKNNEGYYVYMEATSNSDASIDIEYPDTENVNGQLAPYQAIKYCTWGNGSVHNGHTNLINGAFSSVITEDNMNKIECFVPNSFFPADNFVMKSGNSNISSADIKNIDEQSGSSEESTENTEPTVKPTEKLTEPTTEPAQAAYEGIVIDGKFDDWESVPKYDVNDVDIYGNKKPWTVNQVAMVWDGDRIYLYFMAKGDQYNCGNWDSVCGAGPHGNGQYAITTDIGRTVLIQLTNTNGVPGVSGVSDAEVAVNNKVWDQGPHMWEVSIPASVLVYKDTGKDKYINDISFGFYQVKPIITGVPNLQDDGNEDKKFNGIKYDGKYEDWDYYPHSTIQYATSGTHENVVDSEGALYSDGDTLYSHAVTTMPAHLDEAGGEFTQAVTIKVNDTTDLLFSPRFFTVDENGNIDWDCKRDGLENGTYEFYMAGTHVHHGDYKNIKQLEEAGLFVGKMKLTVSGDKDECEWYMNIDVLSKQLRPNLDGEVFADIEAEDIKTISVQYGRLGQQWITTAGTSTGPIVGIILCLGVVGGVLLYRKKRLGKKAA